MQGKKEPCEAKYKAIQAGNTVHVIAFGKNTKNRYEVEFEDISTDDSPSQFQLTRRSLGGKIIKVDTKFAVSTPFSSEVPIETVTVYDAVNGEQIVNVKQTPNFRIEPELKKLLGKKDIRYEKLSAGLSSLIHEDEEIGLNAAVVNSSRVSMTPLFIPSRGGTPETVISIRCDENAHIDLPGVNINSQKGEFRTAKVSLDSLPILSRHEGVHRISSSVKLKPLNDIAAAATQLDNFRKNNNNLDLTGKGVVIGIVDTGIDSSHKCFGNRILSIWDQKIEAKGWGYKDYGIVLTGEMLAASSDVDGHGTHVAGIAAGSDDKYGGVAPEANLIIVKTDFIEGHIQDGIEYIFSEAEKLPGKPPVVVNLSLGGHLNAHDGTDDLSAWINQHTGPGKIVVAAAGNEDNLDIYGAATIVPDPHEPVEIGFKILPEAGKTPPIVLFKGLYERSGNCEISVRPPGGKPTPFQAVSDSQNPTQIYVREGMLITLTTPPAPAIPPPPKIAPLNGDHEFDLKIQTGSKEVKPGTWHIIIRNTGDSEVKVDIWSTVPDIPDNGGFQPPFVENKMKIGSPGCAAEAITVASYVTRREWDSIENIHFDSGSITDENISDSSSRGPLRKGNVFKPDIAAPGEFVASALSKQVKEPVAGNRLHENFIVMSGTSMSCPFITGVCALLLQQNREMTPDDIKLFLKGKGLIQGQSAVEPDLKWGYGLVKF